MSEALPLSHTMASSHITILYIIIFFVVFLANIVSFKSFYRRRREDRGREEEFLRSWDHRADHGGWHSECLPTESLSKAQQDQQCRNLQDAAHGWLCAVGVANGGESQSLGADSL